MRWNFIGEAIPRQAELIASYGHMRDIEIVASATLPTMLDDLTTDKLNPLR
jgi:hypothetical protein